MKKLLPFILACFCISAQAQRSPIFLKADFGLSNIKASSGKTTLSFGYGIGAETFVKAGKYFVINPSLALRRTGYETSGDKVHVNYLAFELPLMMNANGVFPERKSDDMGFIFGAGPFVGYAVSGNFSVSGVKRSMNFGNSVNDNRKPLDVGLILKSALRLNKVFIGSQYNIGFTNLIPKDRITNGSSIKSRNFLFYVSVPLSGWK